LPLAIAIGSTVRTTAVTQLSTAILTVRREIVKRY
jgi:hypothetical protein